MKTKSGDKASPPVHSPIASTSKNVVIPGTSVVARRSANIQKAQDGSLIYKRRQSLAPVPSTSTPDAKGPGSDALVITRSQGKEASRSRMSLPVEKRSDRKRIAESEPNPSASVPKRRRTIRNTADGTCVESDAFCWICHRDGLGICCELCPRLFHVKCLGIEAPDKEWICPECEKIMIAENTETRSKAMSMLSMELLCSLLKFVLQRMKYSETDVFQRPVDCALIPTYTDYIFNAMDFGTLEKNIKKRQYGSTEAFVSDVKWILHNCIVFNGKKHRLTNIAKTILKICRHETNEIEVCPDCYMNSCVKQGDKWFCEPCRVPHTLVWAKMKGYPFWPAKVLREEKGLIDVRFFGEHDRAWVPVSQIFMMSEEPPTSLKNRKGFEPATEELRQHVDLIREKFGTFQYAPHRTPYDPKNPYSKVDLSATPQRSPVFGSKKIKKSKLIGKVRTTDDTQNMKRVKVFMTKISDKSSATRTASALRLKYSSITSTRFNSGKRTELTPATETTRTTTTVVDSGVSKPEEASTEKILKSELMDDDGCSDSFQPPISSQSPADSHLVGICELLGNAQSLTPHPDQNSAEELEAGHASRKHDDVGFVGALDCQGDVKIELGVQITDRNLPVKQTSLDDTVLADRVLSDVENVGISDQPISVDSGSTSSENSSVVDQLSDKSLKRNEISCDISSAGDQDKDSDQKMAAEIRSHETSNEDDDLRRDESACGFGRNGSIEKCLLLSSEEASTCFGPASEIKSIPNPNTDSGPDKCNDKLLIDIPAACIDVTPNRQISVVTPLQKLISLSDLNCSKIGAENLTVEMPIDAQSDKDISECPANAENSRISTSTLVAAELNSSDFSVQATASRQSTEGRSDPVATASDSQTPDGVDVNAMCEAAISDRETRRAVRSDLDPLKDRSSDCTDAISEAVTLTGKEIDVTESSAEKSHSPNSSVVENAEIISADCSSATSKAEVLCVGISGSVVSIAEASVIPVLSNTLPLEIGFGIKSITVASDKNDLAPSKWPYQADVDSLLMEVDCEQDVEGDDTVVIIDDDLEDSVNNTSVKIQNVKSLRLPKSSVEKLCGSDDARVSSGLNTFLPNAPALAKARLPAMPSLRTPLLYRSAFTDPNTHVTPSSGLNHLLGATRVPPVREIISSASRTALGECASSAANSTALNHSPVLDFGNSTISSETNGRSTVKPEALPFAFNIAGFDYSKYTNKIINSSKSMLQEFCQDMINAEAGSAIRKHLQLELERMKWKHEQELNELRHNAGLQLTELRLALEHDKEYSLAEVRQKFEEEKNKEIEEVKKKQWCANCGKEAIFYCCWNTSYCNYPCQQAHWPKHMHSCAQAPEGSQPSDSQSNSQTEERTANAASGQQQNWKDNIDLSINAALKQQQEWDRQVHLTYPTPQTGHQYLSNQNLSVPSTRMLSSIGHHSGSHQQQQQQQHPVVQVPYSYNSTIHVTPYLSDAQQSGSLLRQPFRLRAVQQQQQPGIVMYPSVPTAVLTSRRGGQSVQRGSVYQPNSY